MILKIVIGLIIWLVIPLFFESKLRRKKGRKKAIAMLCKIIGIAIIIWAVIQQLL